MNAESRSEISARIAQDMTDGKIGNDWVTCKNRYRVNGKLAFTVMVS